MVAPRPVFDPSPRGMEERPFRRVRRILAHHNTASTHGRIEDHPELIPGADIGIRQMMESDTVSAHVEWIKQKVALHQV